MAILAVMTGAHSSMVVAVSQEASMPPLMRELPVRPLLGLRTEAAGRVVQVAALVRELVLVEEQALVEGQALVRELVLAEELVLVEEQAALGPELVLARVAVLGPAVRVLAVARQV